MQGNAVTLFWEEVETRPVLLLLLVVLDRVVGRCVRGSIMRTPCVVRIYVVLFVFLSLLSGVLIAVVHAQDSRISDGFERGGWWGDFFQGLSSSAKLTRYPSKPWYYIRQFFR